MIVIMDMEILSGFYTFILGAIFGSFALVIVDRMHAGKDWVKGRSVCEYCGKKLSVKDLAPVVSWLSTGGKCRYCHKRLSLAYPLVEIGLGLAFLGSYVFLPYELSGIGIILFGLWLTGLVVMSSLIVFDLRWFLLPNKLVYPLIGLAFVHRIIAFFVNGESFRSGLLSCLAAVGIGAGLFWVLHQVSRGRWIGDGDYRLGVAIALFLGTPLVTWSALFFASLLGLTVSLPFIAKSKKKLKLKIPFGPFLIGGLYVAYLLGQQLIDWYSATFLYL